MQIPVGVALDLYGPGRTVAILFTAALAGTVLSSTATSFPQLLAAQALLGIGSSPAFLAPLVFAARHFRADRFASVSGLVLGIGGLGMLATATPLAWVVERSSFRVAFAILAAFSAASILACWWLAQEPGAGSRGETLARAFREAAGIFTQRHAAGILILGSANYAVIIAVRALWITPLFTERHGFSLVQAGHVALAMSVTMLVGPMVFGRIDPGGLRRRRLIVSCTLLMAILVAAIGHERTSAAVDIGLIVTLGGLSGFSLLQYADVRSSYPAAVVGRALGVFNMALFLGVAMVQWASGLVADLALSHAGSSLTAVFAALAMYLALAAAAFALLPRSPLLH
jgi:predicted MFS family arabinose efflux permease